VYVRIQHGDAPNHWQSIQLINGQYVMCDGEYFAYCNIPHINDSVL